MSDLLIDCDTCIARGPGCGDCVVTVFLSIAPHRPAEPARPQRPAARVQLDEAERQAVSALAAAGLVPPLRLVSGLSYNDQDIA